MKLPPGFHTVGDVLVIETRRPMDWWHLPPNPKAGWEQIFSRSFTHYPSAAACEEALRSGDPSLVAPLLAQSRRLRIPPIPRGRAWRVSDDGDTLHLDRYLASSPRAFLHRPRSLLPVVSVLTPIDGNCNLTPEAISRRGAAALALLVALLRAGYSAELWAGAVGHSTYAPPAPLWRFSIACLVHAGRPFSLPHLAALIATPLLFRGAMFRSWVAAPWVVRDGLGFTVNWEDAPFLAPVQSAATVCIPSHFRSDAETQSWLDSIDWRARLRAARAVSLADIALRAARGA